MIREFNPTRQPEQSRPSCDDHGERQAARRGPQNYTDACTDAFRRPSLKAITLGSALDRRQKYPRLLLSPHPDPCPVQPLRPSSTIYAARSADSGDQTVSRIFVTPPELFPGFHTTAERSVTKGNGTHPQNSDWQTPVQGCHWYADNFSLPVHDFSVLRPSRHTTDPSQEDSFQAWT